jgi:hypothetical protein
MKLFKDFHIRDQLFKIGIAFDQFGIGKSLRLHITVAFEEILIGFAVRKPFSSFPNIVCNAKVSQLLEDKN